MDKNGSQRRIMFLLCAHSAPEQLPKTARKLRENPFLLGIIEPPLPLRSRRFAASRFRAPAQSQNKRKLCKMAHANPDNARIPSTPPTFCGYPAPPSARKPATSSQGDRGARHLHRPQHPRNSEKNRQPGQPRHRRRNHETDPRQPTAGLVTTFYTYLEPTLCIPTLNAHKMRMKGHQHGL